MIDTRKAAIEINGLTIYPDASGAVATISCGEYKFAAHYVNHETKLYGLGNSYFNKSQLRVAVQRCEIAFSTKVKESTNDVWQERHTELYGG